MVPVMDKYLKENKYDAILMPHLFPAEMVTQMKAKGSIFLQRFLSRLTMYVLHLQKKLIVMRM